MPKRNDKNKQWEIKTLDGATIIKKKNLFYGKIFTKIWEIINNYNQTNIIDK